MMTMMMNFAQEDTRTQCPTQYAAFLQLNPLSLFHLFVFERWFNKAAKYKKKITFHCVEVGTWWWFYMVRKYLLQ